MSARVLDLLGGIAAGQAMVAAVTLRVFDHLADGPRSAAALASALGGEERVLVRILRVLVAEGLLTTDGETFGLTPHGDVLRWSHPRSLAPRVTVLRDETVDAMAVLDRAVRGPPSAFEHAHGRPLWDHLAAHPERSRAFLAFMDESVAGLAPAVVEAVDWAGVRTLVDVGGGRGTVLAAALRARPGLRGILFDRPEAVDGPTVLGEVAGRCTRVAGDYREGVPEGADAYLMCRVLHGWDDAGCVQLLRACRGAMADGGRVWIVERVRPDGPPTRVDALADLRTMAHTGGEERTRDDFARVLERAGLRLTDVRPAGRWMSVVEGVAG